LEGDDYWTSSTKLTRQVQLMRDRADTTLAFHRVRSVDGDGTLGDEHWPRSQAKEFRLADLIRANEIQTCSVLYRAGFVPTLPAWFTSLVMNDWPLHLLHAYQGSIGYIDDEMAYYRMHSGGLWSGRTLAARYLESARTLANVAYRSAPDARTKRALVRSARRFGLSALRNAALDHDPVLVTRALRAVARPAL
jgi:hypothetical protein